VILAPLLKSGAIEAIAFGALWVTAKRHRRFGAGDVPGPARSRVGSGTGRGGPLRDQHHSIQWLSRMGHGRTV
jgi:hypothetical protein